MRRELVALGLQSHVAQEALGAQCLVASEQRTAMSFAVRQEVGRRILNHCATREAPLPVS